VGADGTSRRFKEGGGGKGKSKRFIKVNPFLYKTLFQDSWDFFEMFSG